MCGIAATSSPDPIIIGEMLSRISHRGPDEKGLIVKDGVTLGIQRLSITDLKNGSQPITSRNGSSAIVFNGAIYNTKFLTENFDLNLSTGNDAEVVLELYEKLGLRSFEFLEAMYAIIISSRGNLIYLTDQFGIKPLYRFVGENVLLASEPSAFGHELLPHIERVKPGFIYVNDLIFQKVNLLSPPQELWEITLEKSVTNQIPDEVPWAALLSGGVDSGVLAALAARDQRIKTFSCGMAGAEDLESAARLAATLGSDHEEILISPTEIELLVKEAVKTTGSFEPWLIKGAVGTLTAARGIHQKGFKVVLSGEGADELFAGYADFAAMDGLILEEALLNQQEQLGATECLRLDRSTMRFSVEARVPYLSQKVVSQVRALPTSSKKEGSANKIALRRYAENLIPREHAFRAKTGFSIGTGISALVRELALSNHREWASRDAVGKYAPVDLDPTSPEISWFLGLWLNDWSSLGTSWADLSYRKLVRSC